MASVKTYQDSHTIVNYHPEEKVIHIKAKKGASPEDLKKIEDKIKTTLTVDSTEQENPTSKIMQLGQNTQELTVHEFLQSVLQGGEEIEDAGDVGDEEVDATQVQPPLPAQPGVMPGGQPPMSPGMLPTESFSVSDAFNMLVENFFTQQRSEKLLEATYRIGEHWDIISRAMGKGKQQIQHSDVLSLRRTYTKKRKSRGRDEVLRALDRVARYFVRKLRNTVGEDSARIFRQRYKKIGELTPLDYAEEKPGAVDTQLAGDQDIEQELDPRQVDFSDFFPKPDEKKEEDDEEEVDPGEEYGEEPEEEYPE